MDILDKGQCTFTHLFGNRQCSRDSHKAALNFSSLESKYKESQTVTTSATILKTDVTSSLMCTAAVCMLKLQNRLL